MKLIQIYKTSKYYIIETNYKTESWVYQAGLPIFHVPLNEIGSLSEKIFLSLDSSRHIDAKEESEMRLGTKKLLKHLKVSSFSSLYKNSTSCMVSLDKNIINIIPRKCFNDDPRKGLEEVKGVIFEMKYLKKEKENITKKIIDVLSIKY